MTFIKAIFLALMVFGAAQAGSAREAAVHYIGFNSFKADNAQSAKQFDTYLAKLKPIMKRYHMTADAYEVTNGSSDMRADVVTFGTAPSMRTMQAFFQDADFQKIFPELLEALDDHHVVFTAGPLAPEDDQPQDYIRLRLTWTDRGQSSERKEGAKMELGHAPEVDFPAFVNLVSGTYANRGLAGDVKDIEAPTRLEMLQTNQIHTYLQDPHVARYEQTVGNVSERVATYWLKPRHH